MATSICCLSLISFNLASRLFSSLSVSTSALSTSLGTLASAYTEVNRKLKLLISVRRKTRTIAIKLAFLLSLFIIIIYSLPSKIQSIGQERELSLLQRLCLQTALLSDSCLPGGRQQIYQSVHSLQRCKACPAT